MTPIVAVDRTNITRAMIDVPMAWVPMAAVVDTGAGEVVEEENIIMDPTKDRSWPGPCGRGVAAGGPAGTFLCGAVLGWPGERGALGVSRTP